MKIICCGNPDRGDDGAGALVAARLRAVGIPVHWHAGEALALLDAWTGEDDVVLVDAVITGAPAGTFAVWNVDDLTLAGARFSCSTHALGVADALEIARAFGSLPRRLLIYGIEAQRFTPGSPPSDEVARAAETVAQQIARYRAATVRER